MSDEARGADSLGPAQDRPGLGRVRQRGRSDNAAPSRSGYRAAQTASRFRTTYAALDLGTNNCRLLVARPIGDSFRVIDAFSRIVRLGEGLSVSGRLSEAAMARAIAALTICRDKMRQNGVARARLIATEACRIAKNGEEFRARIREELGLDLEIVARETEAFLAATGCTSLIDPQAETVLLFDIGGGSSELVLLGPPQAMRRGPPWPVIKAWASLPVGVVTLAERHGGVTVSREVFETMVAEVKEHIDRFTAIHGDAWGRMHMLGTSGTVTTIAGVHLELPRYDRRRVDGCWLSGEETSKTIERLLAMSYEERVANPCIGPERADLVLAGCAILEAIRRTFPCKRLRVADRGLREGMLVEMMRADGVWGARRSEVMPS